MKASLTVYTVREACHVMDTVWKHVAALEAKGLLYTENTAITTRVGCKRNGSLRYTVRPIQEVLDMCYERQMAQLKQVAALECIR